MQPANTARVARVMNKIVPPLDDTTKDHVERLMCILEGARSKGGGLRAMPWTFPFYLSKKKAYLIHITADLPQ
jgi:hypothetical protein